MHERRQGGATVAGVAVSHGINANIVHRWLREQTPSALSVQSRAFVPVTLSARRQALHHKQRQTSG